MSVLFAVASKTGTHVDQHFGHATRLFVFLASSDGVCSIEARDVQPYCSGNCEPEEKLSRLINTIGDCSYLLCLRIGYSPAEKLKAAGIQAIETYGNITQIIQAIISKKGVNEMYRLA